MEPKTCYLCKNFSLCRLRDKAYELGGYFNKTGNFMGSEFLNELYALMGGHCFVYGEEDE